MDGKLTVAVVANVASQFEFTMWTVDVVETGIGHMDAAMKAYLDALDLRDKFKIGSSLTTWKVFATYNGNKYMDACFESGNLQQFMVDFFEEVFQQ